MRHEWRFLHTRRSSPFEMNPCGSGQRLWRNGAYEGEDSYG